MVDGSRSNSVDYFSPFVRQLQVFFIFEQHWTLDLIMQIETSNHQM